MDPLTQAGLGGAIGGAFFHRRLGRRAILFGALAGMAPDLDILVGLWGDEWTTLAAHRGPTHSLLVLPFAAVPIGWGASKVLGAGRDVRDWILLAFWGLWTHPILDSCTTYGTQLLSPFSDRRFVFDAVAIIDPWFTLPLLLALLVAYTPWGTDERIQRFGRVALTWAVIYLSVGFGLTLSAEAAARRQLAAEGITATDVRGGTPLFFPALRRVSTYDGDRTYRVGFRSALAPEPIQWTAFEHAEDERVDAALASRGGQTFAWFADGFAQAQLRGDDVIFADRRYGLVSAPDQTPFWAVARFRDGKMVQIRQESGMDRSSLSLRDELRQGWLLTLGLDEEDLDRE